MSHMQNLDVKHDFQDISNFQIIASKCSHFSERKNRAVLAKCLGKTSFLNVYIKSLDCLMPSINENFEQDEKKLGISLFEYILFLSVRMCNNVSLVNS